MGTKISDFEPFTGDLNENKDDIWVPTYNSITSNNYKVNLGSIMKGSGQTNTNAHILIQKWCGGSASTPIELLVDDVSYDVLYGEITLPANRTPESQPDEGYELAFVPIYNDDDYKNEIGELQESWPFISDDPTTDRYNKWVLVERHDKEITVPLFFEAPEDKKLVAIGIKGSTSFGYEYPIQNVATKYQIFGLNKEN